MIVTYNIVCIAPFLQFENMWVSRQLYEEEGPKAVHRCVM